MKYNDLIEEIAQRIYYYDGGMYPEEYETITGEKKLHWDKLYNHWKEEDCLAQHQRDEYRVQANQVVDYLLSEDLIAITKPEDIQ